MRYLALLLTLLAGCGNYLVIPNSSRVRTADCTLTLSPVTAGNELCVSVQLTDPPAPIVGAQVFIAYDATKLQLTSVRDGDYPFQRRIYFADSGGQIDYASGVLDGQDGVQANSRVASFYFTKLDECGNVGWRTGPNGALNMLSDDQANPVLPLLRGGVLCIERGGEIDPPENG